MDTTWQERLRRLGGWLDASPAELAALGILLLGGLALAIGLVGADTAALSVAPSEPNGLAPSRAPATIVVHVTGAVHAPGVVELAEHARVADAIEAAGGAALDAWLQDLNLARRVSDGEQLHVRRIGDGAASEPTEHAASASAWRSDGRLDLNAASAADFEELPGIGPVLADRIISWRDQHGPFTNVGQLREVAGIGEKTFQSLSALVVV